MSPAHVRNDGLRCRAGCFVDRVFSRKENTIVELHYRAKGYFTGRELYFHDPSGNRLELRDPTWKQGMPAPPFEEIVRS